ncbi:MAG: VWA domain-containing protein [Acidobacteriota bacterium]
MLSIFLLLGLFLFQAPPQESPQEESEDQGFRIGVAVNQVFLSVNARSGQGGFVRDLPKESFRIYEDGVQQEILNFYSESVPVHVVLLIDISGSTRHSQASIRRASLQFAKSLTPEDRVAIITFNDAPRLIQDWTGDLGTIEIALKSIYAKGVTVLNDALYVTFDDLLKTAEGKKAVILLTDGVDTGSMIDYDEAMKLAIESEAMVYVVSKLEEYWGMAIAERFRMQARAQMIPRELSDEFIIDKKRFLQRLAHQTGGKVLDAAAFTSLTDTYAQVAEELKNQYYLSYIPSNIIKDGRWRNVEVRVNQSGVTVSTRPGYYAPLEGESDTP